jgi:hypothetical protein
MKKSLLLSSLAAMAMIGAAKADPVGLDAMSTRTVSSTCRR